MPSFYISPTGDDANDGLTPSTPFKTPQKGVDSAPNSISTEVFLMAGEYHNKVDVAHFKFVNFRAYQNGWVGMYGDGAPGPVFTFEDIVIGTISNLTFYTAALACRQNVIADVNNCIYAAANGQVMLAANENSKINILNPTIAGQSAYFATASDRSNVTLGGNLIMSDGLSYISFLAGYDLSTVNAKALVVSAGKTQNGLKLTLVQSRGLINPVVLPGIGNYIDSLSSVG